MGPEKHAPIELQSEGDFLLFHLHAGLLKHQDVERERVPQEKERERECACRVIERSETVDYCVERTRGCNSTMLTTQIVVSHIGKLERLYVVFFI